MIGEVKEIVPPGGKLEEVSEDAPAAPVPETPQLSCGFVIGLREDGQVVFDVLGLKPGLIELMGLHKIAGERIESMMDMQLGGKFSKIIEKLDNIIKKS